MSSSSPHSARLPVDAQQRIVEACTRFDQDWRAGSRPRIEDFLATDSGDDERRELFRSLLEVEFYYRRQAGELIRLDDYLARFTGQVDIVRELFHEPDSTTDGRKSSERTGPHLPAADRAAAIVLVIPGYEILEELGRGGMGVVYKARQHALQRTVALKMILAGVHAGEAEMARFRTEAEAIARLQHPNIVQVHDIGMHDGKPFFSLEYCPGGSLDRLLQGTPQLPKQAARLVETLARAMQSAHDANVIHRDLKPANILLSFSRDAESSERSAGADALRSEDSASRLNQFVPKITDFGLARKLDEAGQTQSGAIMGTPSYMAPEQAGGKTKELGPACDVYALGAILYECLTGRPPFKAATAMDTIMQVLVDEPVPPSSLQSTTPRDLETICLKCLAKEPAKRYATAEALAEDLKRYLVGEPIVARPVGRLERGMKWVRRNPVVAVLIGAIATMFLLGTIISTYFAMDANHQAVEARAALKTAENEKKRAEDRLSRAEIAVYAGQLAQAQLERKEGDQTSRPRSRGQGSMPGAQLERKEGDQTRALEILESTQWNLRGVECRYLWTLYNSKDENGGLPPEVRALIRARGFGALTRERGFGSVFTSVAISADVKRIVAGGNENRVKVWDWNAYRGWLPRGLKGHTDRIISVAISADGKRIVSGSGDKTVKVWNAATGKEILSLKHTADVNSVAISPDGKRIVSGSGDNTVKVWDAATGKESFTLKHTAPVLSVAISPDGKRIVSGSRDKTVKMWDADTGEDLLTLKGHSAHVNSVAISPDGKRIVSGSGDNTVKVWTVDTGEELLTLKGHTQAVNCVAISPDGRRIISASMDATIKVWNASTGQHLLSLKGHMHGVTSVAISPDGQRILSAGRYEMKMWDATTEPDRSLTGHKGVVRGAAISADGKRIVSGSEDTTLKVWDAEKGQELFTLTGHMHIVTSVAISSDGKRIVSGSYDNTVKVWNAATAKEILSLKHSAPVNSVAISPDGKRIVSGSGDNTVKVWDAATAKEILSLKHSATVTSVAISQDGNRVVSGSGDNTVKVWNANSGEDLLTLKHTNPVNSVAISQDGERIVSGSGDNTLKVWTAATGKEILSLKLTVPVTSVAISPDGKRIVSAGEVWDVATGKKVFTLKGAGNLLSISADGKRIINADYGSGKLNVWDVEKGW